MNADRPVQGLWCALLSPLAPSGELDPGRLVAHARILLTQGVDGVAPFGTTGEGQSFGLTERMAGVEALLAAGIPAGRVVAATGCAALPEAITLTRHATQAGCAASLVLPPFFWKGVADDGLYAWYAQLIDGVADPRLKVLLYHIPQVSGTPLSVDLVARLAQAFPGVVIGIKDSAGEWSNTQALLARVPQLGIMVGHEPHLPQLMRAGGAGTICGVANLFPGLVRALMTPAVTSVDEARVATFIEIAFRQPFLAGFKAMLAERLHDPVWRAVRPPLVALDETVRRTLLMTLRDAGLAGNTAEQ